jgi:hypothetical protein
VIGQRGHRTVLGEADPSAADLTVVYDVVLLKLAGPGGFGYCRRSTTKTGISRSVFFW